MSHQHHNILWLRIHPFIVQCSLNLSTSSFHSVSFYGPFLAGWWHTVSSIQGHYRAAVWCYWCCWKLPDLLQNINIKYLSQSNAVSSNFTQNTQFLKLVVSSWCTPSYKARKWTTQKWLQKTRQLQVFLQHQGKGKRAIKVTWEFSTQWDRPVKHFNS